MIGLSVLFELLLIIAVVFGLWYVMWKFVFETNPEIREFFDLDKKPKDYDSVDGRSMNRKKL
jgi:hypothetical protein